MHQAQTHPFEALAPLAPGITVIEASAGTGKTYQITNLVLRFVAEEAIPLREILVVTFTRAATAELRDRIRRRLGEGLSAILAGPGADQPQQPDDVLRAIAERARADPRVLRRVRDALEAFDEAFVSTIHGFCQRTLQSHAFESDADFGLELVEDPDRLLEELVDDFLVRELYAVDAARYDFLVGPCAFAREALFALARAAAADPDVEVTPAPDDHPIDGGEDLAAAFLARWPHLADEVGGAMQAALRAGLFTPRQRTYRVDTAREHVEALLAWLRAEGAPVLAGPPPDRSFAYFFGDMSKQLADPDARFTTPGLEELLTVIHYRERAAASARARFVSWVRAELDRRNAERRVQTYQDLMRTLARRLVGADEARRRALIDAVAGRFRAALIDEFQDTDNLQWDIFRALFGAGHHYLYLIGDPKQAIYGFRGANVHVYLAARDAAGSSATMSRNWRSDRPLVDGLNHLMHRPGFFGTPRIAYEVVDTPPRAPAQRLRLPASAGPEARAPLQLVFVGGQDPPSTRAGGPPAPSPRLNKGDLNEFLPARVAEDIVDLLEGGAELHDPEHPDAGAEGFRPLRPGDLAVLVRTGRQGAAVLAALHRARVPAVRSGGSSVLASEEARHLLLWLEAVADAGRDVPARAAVTSPLFGWGLAALRAVDEEEPAAVKAWEDWLESLGRWQRELLRGGVMGAFRAAAAEEGVAERLLGWPDGERRLTNLWHVVELLHAAETQGRLGLTGLVSWLRRARRDTTVEREVTELRLERDDEAVKIVTMHAAKGLEYPVVWVPWLWDGRLIRAGDVPQLVLPHPDRATERLLDVTPRADVPPKDAHMVLAEAEIQREHLRLLYVALTRARHRCVVYTGHVKSLETSPIAAALHGGAGPDRLAGARDRVEEATAADLFADLEALAQTSGADGASPSVAASHARPPTGRAWRGVPRAKAPLAAREFTRGDLDRIWGRASYTSILKAGQRAHAAHAPHGPHFTDDLGDEPDREGFEDAGLGAPRAADAPALVPIPGAAPVPLATFPAGADPGTLLHEVLERVDFRSIREDGDRERGLADLSALAGACAERYGYAGDDVRDVLASGLDAVLRTPIGGPLGGKRLCDFGRGDRLDELRFDLPVAGGEGYGRGEGDRPVTGAELVAALGVARGEPGVSEEYLASLRSLDAVALAGFLNGFIDLVLRDPDTGRWYLIDYKSNILNPERAPAVTIAHYTQPRLAAEMASHHYHLQYHLYAVALHRYLAWRLGGAYRYADHFGGAYYLFVRGMTGPEDAPPPGELGPGIFFDRPAQAAVEALSALFARGATS